MYVVRTNDRWWVIVGERLLFEWMQVSWKNLEHSASYNQKTKKFSEVQQSPLHTYLRTYMVNCYRCRCVRYNYYLHDDYLQFTRFAYRIKKAVVKIEESSTAVKQSRRIPGPKVIAKRGRRESEVESSPLSQRTDGVAGDGVGKILKVPLASPLPVADESITDTGKQFIACELISSPCRSLFECPCHVIMYIHVCTYIHICAGKTPLKYHPITTLH